MNKLLIKIASRFTHSRRVLGLLEFGLINALKTKLREPKLEFPHKLSILAIAKNEGPYFREWIEFHKMMGVEKFYIYDNESTDDTKEILAPYIKSGLVEYTWWPGIKQQTKAYKDAIAKYKFDTQWLAIIDLDEFLVPAGGGVLQSFGLAGLAAAVRQASPCRMDYVWL
ncbi:MAG: glycosyltransferase family 92 protein [Rickettsiales bacterium]|jgi:cellulose synthase/poly-beta-1,6-N-acetylglucosamine synthase-like glycosyltransferase|nr:glycosyltransferase family 92 protein [Rickettsiales bacterium]